MSDEPVSTTVWVDSPPDNLVLAFHQVLPDLYQLHKRSDVKYIAFQGCIIVGVNGFPLSGLHQGISQSLIISNPYLGAESSSLQSRPASFPNPLCLHRYPAFPHFFLFLYLSEPHLWRRSVPENPDDISYGTLLKCPALTSASSLLLLLTIPNLLDDGAASAPSWMLRLPARSLWKVSDLTS